MKGHECIQRDNIIYVIPKDTNESREIYVERVNYIIKLSSKNDTNFDDLINKSRIWRNTKYYGMQYS